MAETSRQPGSGSQEGGCRSDRRAAVIRDAERLAADKYDCPVPVDVLRRVHDLIAAGPAAELCARPFFLVKAGWLYAHATTFLGCDAADPDSRDKTIADIAVAYLNGLVRPTAEPPGLQPVSNPRRVVLTTFWDRSCYDPCRLLHRAAAANLEGVELGIDFHPFNPARLLPEEFSPAKRAEIRELSARLGVRIHMHAPLIGPYTPVPTPAGGKQRFYDPAESLQLQLETVELARDIGAESVVMHYISPNSLPGLARLISAAAGSAVRVTIENYCQTAACVQTSRHFLDAMDRLRAMLPEDIRARNFGITLDVGHLNIEGEDPLTGAIRIGGWCLKHGVYLRMHATDNYGPLLFAPPDFSADVHGNVAGRGIRNGLIIRALRSMGLSFNVVAEQIKPLSAEDIEIVHRALTDPVETSFLDLVARGRQLLEADEPGGLLTPEVASEDSYCFLAAAEGRRALRDYLAFRTIQDKKYLYVDEARRISSDFMLLPEDLRNDLAAYLDDLLLPVQTESGTVSCNQLDLVCQNIDGSLFRKFAPRDMTALFSRTRRYAPDEDVCRQGTPGEEMHRIARGSAAVLIDGFEVARLGPGDVFGEIGLFYNVGRSATVRAREAELVVGSLNRAELAAVLGGGSEPGLRLARKLYDVLPQRLRVMNVKYRTVMGALRLMSPEAEPASRLGRRTAVPPVPEADFDAVEGGAGIFPSAGGSTRVLTRTYAAAEVIFREGDEPDGLYLMQRGQAMATTGGEGKEAVILGILHPGEVFGEMALIEGISRSATVTATEPTRVEFVPREDFETFIRTGSEEAARFMGVVCRLLFERILLLDRCYGELRKGFPGNPLPRTP